MASNGRSLCLIRYPRAHHWCYGRWWCKARLDAQLRATQLARLDDALTNLAGKVGRRPYTTSAAVHKRVRTLLAHHPARRFLEVTVHGGPTQPPAPRLHRPGPAKRTR